MLGKLLEDDVEERLGKTTVINTILLLEMNVKRPALERVTFCFWIEILSGRFQASHNVAKDVRSTDGGVLITERSGWWWSCVGLMHNAVDFERGDAIGEGECGGRGGVRCEFLLIDHVAKGGVDDLCECAVDVLVVVPAAAKNVV